MPWLQKAMKDAAWLRYASGRCLATFDPEISEWGNLMARTAIDSAQAGSHTQGSETSQYLEEKKTTPNFFIRRAILSAGEKVLYIPLVAASETGRAQTGPHHTESEAAAI